jgi:carbohydrate-selective porin OprB
MENVKHWTARSTDDFAYRIASDFIAQIETKMEKEEIKRGDFAKLAGLSPGRISQVLNSPGSFRLKSVVSYAKAVGMKVAIVAYDDEDPENNAGPISAQVFTNCWQNAGRPRDLFEVSTPQVQQFAGRPERTFAQEFYRRESGPITHAEKSKGTVQSFRYTLLGANTSAAPKGAVGKGVDTTAPVDVVIAATQPINFEQMRGQRI